MNLGQYFASLKVDGTARKMFRRVKGKIASAMRSTPVNRTQENARRKRQLDKGTIRV